MFALLSKLSRSHKAASSEQPVPAARAASAETLEDRRLYSASSGGDVASFSWGESNSGTMSATLDKASPKLTLAAAQHTGGANIIAILIG
jgi:hypothetical protein